MPAGRSRLRLAKGLAVAFVLLASSATVAAIAHRPEWLALLSAASMAGILCVGLALDHEDEE